MESSRFPSDPTGLPEVRRPDGPVTYVCPMHPEVTSDTPARSPQCGMKLLATIAGSTPEPVHHDHGARDYGAQGDRGGHGVGTGSSGKTTWSRSTG